MNAKLKFALYIAGALIAGAAFGASIPVVSTIAEKLKTATGSKPAAS